MGAEVDDSFISMDSYDKPIEGYVFKMGERGLGYYKDTRPAVVTLVPEAVDPAAAASALEFKAKGNEQLKAQNLSDAEEAYSAAIDLDPTQPAFFMNRSLCRLKLGSPQGALEDA